MRQFWFCATGRLDNRERRGPISKTDFAKGRVQDLRNDTVSELGTVLIVEMSGLERPPHPRANSRGVAVHRITNGSRLHTHNTDWPLCRRTHLDHGLCLGRRAYLECLPTFGCPLPHTLGPRVVSQASSLLGVFTDVWMPTPTARLLLWFFLSKCRIVARRHSSVRA